jgi:hypothetical protein
MVRIANGRMTLVTNAMMRLGVLLHEESAEGHSLRRLHDLALSNAIRRRCARLFIVNMVCDAGAFALPSGCGGHHVTGV